MKVALVNESTVVTSNEAHFIASALRGQARSLAKAWERTIPTVAYHSSLATVGPACLIAILDDADQAGALGYHDVAPNGTPYSKVFARTVLNDGGTVLEGAVSVSACASHEFCEMFGDPPAGFWSTFNQAGDEIALELCDPVQNDAYTVQATYGSLTQAVSVSHFVFPSYFNPFDTTGPFDSGGLLRAPAPALRPGGYAILGRVGNEHTKSGREVIGEMPAWKAGMHGRSAARLAS